MQRYGRIKKRTSNLEDRHPQKGYVNWWEAEDDMGCNKSARQQAKRIIEQDIKEYKNKE